MSALATLPRLKHLTTYGRRLMRLTKSDQAWLTAYRTALAAQFPGAVEEMVILRL